MKENFDSLLDYFLVGGFSLAEAVEFLEKTLIAKTLKKAGGNRSEVSRLLKIHRNTLQRKMQEYQIEDGATRRKPPQKARRPSKRLARA